MCGAGRGYGLEADRARMGGGGERCRQGLLELENALLSKTKLTQLTRIKRDKLTSKL